MATTKLKLNIDTEVLKQIKLVAVAYSEIKEEFFPNREASEAEKELDDRACKIMGEGKKIGARIKGLSRKPIFAHQHPGGPVRLRRGFFIEDLCY